MNAKYVWSIELTPEQVSKIKAVWHECLGDPVPLGSGLFATLDFRGGKLRLMAMQPEEVTVLRQALNQISLQTRLDDLDQAKRENASGSRQSASELKDAPTPV